MKKTLINNPAASSGVCCSNKVLHSGFNTIISAPRLPRAASSWVLNPSARINALTIFGFITMILSGCDSDWDGEITVTGCTKLPDWIGWIYLQDSPSIDGIDVIEIKTPDTAENIIRIKTYKSLEDILKVQCNCTEPNGSHAYHEYLKSEINENEVEKLLEKFDPEFFETKNLIVVSLKMGPLTMNVRVDNINKNGIINVTETRKLSPVEQSVIKWVVLGIEVKSSFITPPSMGVKIKSASSF